MTEQKCPRCSGPVTVEEDDNFNCPACQLLFKFSPEGRFTAAMPIRDGKMWTGEPWFVKVRELIDAHNDKKGGASECPKEWKERNAEGLEQCPLCFGPVTKEPHYNFGCSACQLLFQMCPDGGRGISRMSNRDRNKPWPEESWVAKFLD